MHGIPLGWFTEVLALFSNSRVKDWNLCTLFFTVTPLFCQTPCFSFYFCVLCYVRSSWLARSPTDFNPDIQPRALLCWFSSWGDCMLVPYASDYWALMPHVQRGLVLTARAHFPLGRGLWISPYKFPSLQYLHVHGTPWARQGEGVQPKLQPVGIGKKNKSCMANNRWAFAEFAATLRSWIIYLL